MNKLEEARIKHSEAQQNYEAAQYLLNIAKQNLNKILSKTDNDVTDMDKNE